jgi:hypothetical protein
MPRKTSIVTAACLVLFAAFVSPVFAIDQDALAKESEAYCASTAKSEPTSPSTIIAKVNEAAKLLSVEGREAFPKFKGKGSPFIYEGTYIWIHTLENSEMLMHPIKYKMEGQNYTSMKDVKGKRFFVTINRLVKEKGEGWVEYYWPIPGTKENVRKVSFVKGVKLPDGTDVVLGSGIYNANETELAKLEIH